MLDSPPLARRVGLAKVTVCGGGQGKERDSIQNSIWGHSVSADVDSGGCLWGGGFHPTQEQEIGTHRFPRS